MRQTPSDAEPGELLKYPNDLALWNAHCRRGPDADLDSIRDAFFAATWSEAERIQVALYALQLLGFRHTAAASHLDSVFNRVAAPWVKWSFENGYLDLGLHLEGCVYQEYVRSRDTEAHAAACYHELLPSILEGASRIQRLVEGPACLDGVPRLAFFLQSPNDLTNVQVLLRFLTALQSRTDPRAPLEPIVYGFHGFAPQVATDLRSVGVGCVDLRDLAGHNDYEVVRRLEALRSSVIENRVDRLVWMSSLAWLPFAATMGLGAPLAWFSLKYHFLRMPGISRYVTSGDGAIRDFGGHPWQTVRLSGEWFDPGTTGEAEQARRCLPPHRLTLGTLGREEKIADPLFVSTVARLLRDNRDAVFLWTGRTQPDSVISAFKAEGVLDRQVFLGWGNTKVFSQMIDVYLDSFPPPGGFTVRESMAAGAATVFLRSQESDRTGPSGFIRRLLDGEGSQADVEQMRTIMIPPNGERLFLQAESAEEYRALATRLIKEDRLRGRVGEANKACIKAFFEDDQRFLESCLSALS